VPHAEAVAIDVTDVVLDRAPDGPPIPLGTIGGVQIIVLLRHRH
jgi:hypothetical protein